MKRTGVLLLAVLPLLAATACLSVASDDSRGPDAKRVEEAGSLDAEATLADPAKKELAQQIVASAENGTLDWRSAYGYVEDIGDGQGYTAGIIGFCTGTHDLLTLVDGYTKAHPDNALAPYLPALREVDGTDSHEGLDPGFPAAWKQESKVAAFREAQDEKRDTGYFGPALRLAVGDGLGLLGQFVYYDAMVYHGPGSDRFSVGGIRAAALKKADSPAEGGDEKTYLVAFLDARRTAMLVKRPGVDTSRVDTAQRRFLDEGNLDLRTPLEWKVYGDTYKVP
ncbi:chitosanase [Streptomyces sp. SID12501]|uniref:Chitosanase n=1 Tax=Streptomyces sp. SID12501 TaxID=2706042 RepID=A0A6B3BRM7_9ACTN|nr:chitosanase [Streptomyces sp. SID12501]NEC86989.1 chitosanase [Streptomyces sp. SID12501]